MRPRTYRQISGTLIHGAGGGVKDLDVEVWFRRGNAGGYRRFLWRGRTDGSGKFTATLPQDDRQVERALSRARGIESRLELLVWREERAMTFPSGQAGSVSWSTAKQPYSVTATVTEPGAGPTANWEVTGVVHRRDRTPVSATVKVYWKKLNGDSLLATVSSGATDGRYVASFGAPAGEADLYVHAETVGGTRLATSAVHHRVKGFVRVDLRLADATAQGASDYEILDDEVTALLPGGTTADDLTDTDALYLGSRLDEDQARVTNYLAAKRLAAKHSTSNLTAAVYYALLSEGLPGSLGPLSGVPAARIAAALTAAVASKAAPSSVDDAPAAVAADLAAWRTGRMLDDTLDGSLGILLAETTLPSGKWDDFLSLWRAHLATPSATPEDFWDDLESDPDFTAHADDVRKILFTGRLVLNHAPMVAAIKADLGGSFTSARVLAELELADWETLAATSGAPAGMGGTSPEDAYAAAILARVEAAFPTARIRKKASLAGSGWADVTAFLGDNPTFDFERTHIDTGWSGFDVTGLSDEPGTKLRLKAMQRVYRLVPAANRFATVAALLDAGLDSAVKIEKMRVAPFVAAFTATFGTAADARTVYRRASQQAALALSVYGIHTAKMHGVPVRAIPSVSEAVKGDASLVSAVPAYVDIFGEAGTCECSDCESILSPGAYLVDLLTFVEDFGGTSELEGRREDLYDIRLTCPNNDTMLPYVDLVNEVLEDRIAELEGKPRVDLSETTGTAEERRATPEHRNDAVYDEVLETAIFPFRLPFSRGLTEARVFLAHLGMPRHVLVGRVPSGGALATEAVEASERLELSPAQWALVTGTDTASGASEWWKHWGYPTAMGIPDPRPGASGTAGWDDALRYVPEFLKRSGLTLEELKDLLHLTYHDIATHLTLSETCDYDALELVQKAGSGLSGPDWLAWFRAAASPVMRLIRLWRATGGWSLLDLGRVLAVTGSSTVNATSATKVGQLLRLADRTRRGPVELAGWFGPLDTRQGREIERVSEPSLYDRLFQNPTMEAMDPSWNRSVLEALALNTARTDLEHTGVYALASVDNSVEPEQSAVTAAILSGLGIGFEDLDRLKTRVTSLGTTVTLASLSGLARHVSLSRAWGLSIEETLDILDLAGLTPFASLAGAHAALREAEAHRAGPFTTRQLYWLLGQQVEASDAEGPAAERLAEILSGLHTAVVAGDATSRAEAVRTTLAAATGLDADTMGVLLASTSPNLSAGAETSAGAQFVTTTFLGTAAIASRTDAPTQYDTVLRLQKVATILTALALDADETAWVLGHVAGWGLSDLVLPVSATSPATMYAGWRNLRILMAQRARLPADRTPTFVSLAGLVDGGTEADFKAALVARTDWSASDVDDLDGSDGFALAWPAGWRSADAWWRFFDAMETVRRLGMTARQVSRWAGASAGTPEAADIRLTARSKYAEEAAWLSAVTPLQDRLRVLQRDALADFLAQRDPDVDEREDLYGDLLIDVEMMPIQQTTRMRQALCSVQLFVIRCLLAQEPGLSLTTAQTERWEWMKTYRVWEAAVKVFLWPENWIEPDLRTDMSPEFGTFAKSLSSPDLTYATAESAYLTYLDAVNAFSKPEVLAFVHDRRDDADGSVDVLYVFARTKSDPPTYLWRRREDGVRWTPWEELGVSPDTDHLLPVIYHARLYLFWPSIEEEMDDGSETQRQHWNVTLRHAEYRNGGWKDLGYSEDTLAARLEILFTTTSSGTPRTGTLAVTYEEDLTLRAREASEGLYIDLYTQTNRETTNPVLQRVGAFLLGGCDETLKVATLPGSFSSNRTIPVDTLAQEQVFRNDESGSLFVPVDGRAAWADQPELLDDVTVKVWRLVPPTTGITFYADQTELFFEDDARAYLIVPIFDCLDEKEQNEKSFDPGKTIDPRDAKDYTPPSTEPTIPAPTIDIEFHAYPDDSALALTGKQSSQYKSGQRPRRVKGSFTEGSQGAVRLSRAVTSAYTRPLRDLDEYALVVSGDTHTVQSEVLRTLTLASDDEGGDLMTELTARPRWLFQIFYHPFTCLFVGQVRRFGVEGLLAPNADGAHTDLVRQASYTPDVFVNTYDPTPLVRLPYPEEDIDFSYGGAYSLYNWEIFFHGPMLVADRLRAAQRFSDARKWLHYVFDPTRPGGVPDWWRVRPFTDTAEAHIGALEALILGNTDDPALDPVRLRWLLQVAAWRNDPFDPHGIAAIRIRAYRTWTLMRYLDTLIEWGDSLFRQDTIEAINEATNLYVLALELLGERPHILETDGAVSAMSVSDVLTSTSETRLDRIEGLLATPCVTTVLPDLGANLGVLRLLGTFCAPPNPRLLAYWDTLDDRLYKIRNSMNLEGEVRALAIWEPPIDPALLVTASAFGWSLSSVLSSLTVTRPNYRFSYMIQRAYAYCASVRSLGAALLSAYEKRDAEALARLRARHEGSIYDILLEIKDFQLEEAQANVESLGRLQEAVQARADYYDRLLTSGEDDDYRFYYTGEVYRGFEISEGLIPEEQSQLGYIAAAREWGEKAATTAFWGTIWSLSPDVSVGTSGFSVSFGGSQVGTWYRLQGMGHEKSATSNSQIAQLFGVAAALKRRNSEWRFQLEQANAQLEQIAQQIVAAEARVNAVTTEIRQTEQERDNNDELLTFLQDKFTNEELYDWMITEVTTVYFKSYQLALYVARQTEECWQCEIGSDETFVERFSNWDSAKKGLLAGERLQLQLERMETSYLDDDDRELELTKTIRLSELDPAALARLRETRSCSFSIPEIVYDLDGPGQYFRRLKTVAVTVVHAGGTDMVVPMELTLTKAQVRIRERASGYERTGGGDGDFQDNRYVGDVIALSSGRSDSGLFETSLRDERYLPFERAGAISDWTLAIPSSYAPLRSRDITDIEMHIRFTAREGSDEFRNLVNAYLLDLADEQVQSWKWVGTTLTAYDSRLMHFIRASHDFPDAWAAFKATASGSPSLSVSLPASLKPPVLEGVDLYVARIWVALSIAGDATDFYVDIDFTFGGTPKTLTLAADTTINSQPVGSASYTSTNRPLATSLSAISLDVDIGTWSGELSELEEMLIFFEWVKTA